MSLPYCLFQSTLYTILTIKALEPYFKQKLKELMLRKISSGPTCAQTTPTKPQLYIPHLLASTTIPSNNYSSIGSLTDSRFPIDSQSIAKRYQRSYVIPARTRSIHEWVRKSTRSSRILAPCCANSADLLTPRKDINFRPSEG